MSVNSGSILILGGTSFVGRHLTELALAQGHRLTLFNRGQSNPGLFADVEKLQGDRETDLSALTHAIDQGRRWDAVIDVTGYIPCTVQASAQLLAKATDHFTYISTVSVYADHKTANFDEAYPLGTLTAEAVAQVKSKNDVTGENYGPLKALCEHEVRQVFGDHALIIRPGLVVGPYDPTDRFTYWPHRVAQGGNVLAPGRPEDRTQFIDARDLAAWTVHMLNARAYGIYNATGPHYPLTFGTLLQTCAQVSAADAQITWVDEAFLLAQQVQPWSDLPLWVPADDPEFAGFNTAQCAKAIAAGLTYRPLADTVRDTLVWVQARPPAPLKAGISREREAELLQRYGMDGKKEVTGRK